MQEIKDIDRKRVADKMREIPCGDKLDALTLAQLCGCFFSYDFIPSKRELFDRIADYIEPNVSAEILEFEYWEKQLKIANDALWSGDGDESLMRAIQDEAQQKLDEIKERGNQRQELLKEFGKMRNSTEHEQALYEDMLKKISVGIESYNKDVEEAMEEEV